MTFDPGTESKQINDPPRKDFLEKWELIPSAGNHLAVLDGLRGLAILIVVAFHALYVNPAHGLVARLTGYALLGGWMGVPIFFVLSGFLISYPFLKGRAADSRFWYPKGYVLRRAAKILPPFYLSILIFLVFYWCLYQDPRYFRSAGMWSIGLGNFLPISPNFNGIYWSLVVESHFYVVLPLLFWITRGFSVRGTVVILFLGLFVIPLVSRQLIWPHDLYSLPNWDTPLHQEIWLKLHRFPCELDYFSWGVAFAGIYVLLAPFRDQLATLSLLGYCGLLLMVTTLMLWGFWCIQFDIRGKPTHWSIEVGHFLPSVASLLMLFFVFDSKCRAARWLSAKWLRLVGLVSFEWFLFHGPIVAWFHENTGPSHGSVWAYAWRTIVPLIITFVFSVAVYRWFSLPILHRVRDRLKGHPVQT